MTEYARLSANRKNAEHRCGRFLAIRSRDADQNAALLGRHVVHYLWRDPDWRAVGDHLERRWDRFDAKHPTKRHGAYVVMGDPALVPITEPTTMLCACGALVILEADRLEAFYPAGSGIALPRFDGTDPTD